MGTSIEIKTKYINIKVKITITSGNERREKGRVYGGRTLNLSNVLFSFYLK